MINVYIVTFLKEKREPEYFTSPSAIFEQFDYDTLHVKKRTIGNHKFKEKPYKNSFIEIKRIVAKNKQDVINGKEPKSE